MIPGLTTRSLRSSPDLAATAAFAVLGLLVAPLPLEQWIKVVVLLPLVFALPGYAVGCALMPARSLPASERIVYTVALSVAVVALSGIVVQLAIGLDRTVWAVVLALLTVAASAVALRRRDQFSKDELPVFWSPPSVPPIATVGILVAVALAGWSISIASVGARNDRERSRFTALWALPTSEQPAGGGQSVTIGVENHRGEPAAYRVRATQGGTQLAAWAVRLGENQRWRVRLPVAAVSQARPLRVALLRDGRVYRRTSLESGLP